MKLMPNTDLIMAIYNDFARTLKDVPATLHVSVRIHISQAQCDNLPSADIDAQASSIGSEEDTGKGLISRLPHVETLTGRPNVQGVLEQVVESSQGPVAVVGLSRDRSGLLRLNEL
jgi:hypothetical protein